MFKLLIYILPALLFCNIAIFGQQPEQYELESINFDGNSFISSTELYAVIASRESPNWFYKFLNNISESIGKPAVYFDSLKIKDDLNSLQNYYRDNGFFEASFRYEYKLDKDNHQADLTYYITENKQYQINKLTVRGLNRVIPELRDKLLKGINVDSADNFSKIAIEKDKNSIRTALLDNGYMLATPRQPEVFIDTSKKMVDVMIGFFPGRQYRIQEIRVEKSGPSKDLIEDTLVRKLVNIKQGDLYSAEKINKSQVRLYRTNLFSSVLVNTVITDTNGNYVPLNISCDIGSLNELSPEIILNNQESALNFGLGLSYTKKNFLGDARNLTLSGSFAIQDMFNIDYSKIPGFLALTDTSILGYLDGRAAIDQPFLFGQPIRTTLELYSTLNKQREYKSTTYGSKISLDFELPKFVYFNSFSTSFTLERSKYVFHPDYIRRVVKDKVTPEQADSLINNLGIGGQRQFTTSIEGFELGASKTNDLLFPTQGYTFSLSGEEANMLPRILGLKPKSQFFRFITKGTYFPKIYNSTTAAFGIKLKVGYLHTYSGAPNEIPLNYLFTAGGSNSIRGWRSRQLIPPSQISFGSFSEQNFILFINNIPVGGTVLLEGSIETRNRIAGPLGSAVFIDYGNTWNGFEHFRFDNIAVAAGFGIRFYSSFAPIRLDFGFKAYDPFTKQNIYQKYKNIHIFKNLLNIIEFHLGIGEAF